MVEKAARTKKQPVINHILRTGKIVAVVPATTCQARFGDYTLAYFTCQVSVARPLRSVLDIFQPTQLKYAAVPIINLQISPHKLRQFRRNRSQAEVAKQIGISRQYLSLIENGRYTPSGDIVARLCFLYGVDIGKLVRKATSKKQGAPTSLGQHTS